MKKRSSVCIEVEKATPRQQKQINLLYRQQRYTAVFSFLKRSELLEENLKVRLLTEMLNKSPAQARKIIRSLDSLSFADLEIIAQYANVKTLESAMMYLGKMQRVYLAQEVISWFCVDFKKIDVILKYHATDNIFWTTIVKNNMDNVLSYAVSKIRRGKEMYYKHLLRTIVRIVMTQGKDRQLAYIIPFVDACYWLDLNPEQGKFCCSRFKPPVNYILACVRTGQLDVLAVIAQNWVLEHECILNVIATENPNAFRIIVSYQKLSEESERFLFSDKKYLYSLKECQEIYLRYHKVPWYKRLRYKFS